jgi:hypothetical protein
MKLRFLSNIRGLKRRWARQAPPLLLLLCGTNHTNNNTLGSPAAAERRQHTDADRPAGVRRIISILQCLQMQKDIPRVHVQYGGKEGTRHKKAKDASWAAQLESFKVPVCLIIHVGSFIEAEGTSFIRVSFKTVPRYRAPPARPGLLSS